MDLISIIVPVYNVDKYLSRCIESLINQTYNNIEIVLIDDGSIDSSAQICDYYANNYNNIYVYHKKNQGLSSARNLGIEKVNIDAKYIGFVDSDDYVHPKMYEILYNNLIKFDSHISGCRFQKVYEKEYMIEGIEDNREIRYVNMNNYFDNADICNFVWNKLYKRECIEGIEFELGRIYEDQLYSPQVIYKSNKVVIDDAKLYYYYQRKGSILNGDNNVSMSEDFFYAKESYIKFGKKIRNKQFTSIATDRYLGMLIYASRNTYDKNSYEYDKCISRYREAFEKYSCEMNNYKARIMYYLYYINPNIYNRAQTFVIKLKSIK